MKDLQTIAVLMPGDMGHAVGRSLREHGHDVITCLDGRGDHTQQRASAAGFRDVGSLAAVVSEADLILSILPPDAALDQAKLVAETVKSQSKAPIYVDCNAISPQTAITVGKTITDVGATFIDAGIIGF